MLFSYESSHETSRVNRNLCEVFMNLRVLRSLSNWPPVGEIDANRHHSSKHDFLYRYTNIRRQAKGTCWLSSRFNHNDSSVSFISSMVKGADLGRKDTMYSLREIGGLHASYAISIITKYYNELSIVVYTAPETSTKVACTHSKISTTWMLPLSVPSVLSHLQQEDTICSYCTDVALTVCHGCSPCCQHRSMNKTIQPTINLHPCTLPLTDVHILIATNKSLCPWTQHKGRHDLCAMGANLSCPSKSNIFPANGTFLSRGLQLDAVSPYLRLWFVSSTWASSLPFPTREGFSPFPPLPINTINFVGLACFPTSPPSFIMA